MRRDFIFISQFENLHFLLLTQMRTAQISHPVPKPAAHTGAMYTSDTEHFITVQLFLC